MKAETDEELIKVLTSIDIRKEIKSRIKDMYLESIDDDMNNETLHELMNILNEHIKETQKAVVHYMKNSFMEQMETEFGKEDNEHGK